MFYLYDLCIHHRIFFYMVVNAWMKYREHPISLANSSFPCAGGSLLA
ncbi:hypothetical protein ESA_01493 [Cronobacter sakazakii ATCC BAA-894]|uniref:Uncharacterized protein n=1 Tax=Cronobacter sakazakii (strain ATCC BAA-894) TaxID=290339 RepID=A7MKC2_CROS8|nr:hypothetical protein ESA_01493 [Cronobacter sakazakii ATCC BAA-894]